MTEKVPFYGVDPDQFDKGDEIGVAELQEIVGASYSDAVYHRKINELACDIESYLNKQGRPITVSCRRGCIVFHTDESAVGHCPKRIRQAEREIVKNHRRMQNIDTSALDERTKQRHERQLIIQAQKLAGMKEAARNARRLTPQTA